MKNFCKSIRLKILDISQNVSALHIGGSFSCVEILSTLYKKFYNKDNIILSKGHAGICQYVILNHLNIISNKDIQYYCTKKGQLGVHPHIDNPGITASTGSLGHGLAISAGMAYANPSKIFFVVMSDGEIMEGSVWESVLLISSLKLKNIKIIIDYNGLQSSTHNKDTHPSLDPIDSKFKSFGWRSAVCDGHNLKEIERNLKKKYNKPFALVAKTIKGYPISFMKNVPLWHYRSPNKDELLKAKKEIINEK